MMLTKLPGIISMLGFAGFTITLLARASKADASFVFTTVNNETGCVVA